MESSDPNDDLIRYKVDWGDNTTDITEYYNSGETAQIRHTWNRESTQKHRFSQLREEQQFTIRAKAIDSNGAESDWSLLEVSMPRVIDYPWQTLIRNIIGWLEEHFDFFEWMFHLPIFQDYNHLGGFLL